MNLGEIWLMVVFPAALTLVQMLVPTRTRRLYLWVGFAVLCTFSIGVTLHLTQATNFSKALIALSAGFPIIFAILRFILAPLWHRYHHFKALLEMLGATDWGLKRSHNVDTYAALESIRTSFSFMGFGFSKYLKATPDHEGIQNKSHLKDSILWKKLEAIYFASPNQTLRILMMNPLAHEIEKYSRFLKEKYPTSDVEEDLYFSLDCLKEIRRAFGRMIEVRFYPNSLTYKPSFRLFFCDEDELYVSFYRWGTTGTDLPYLHLRKSDKTFFLAFQTLFDYLWQHGETADIENMPLTVELQDIYTRRLYSIDRIRKYIRHQLPPHLKDIPLEQLRIAVAAIAGRDSALAILQSAESGKYDCIVPVLVGTPAKYLDAQGSPPGPKDLGDFEVRSDTIRKLKRVIKESLTESSCYLLNMIFIAPDARSWVDTFRGVQAHWHFDTGNSELDRALMSPCIPCHVYIYYVRAMLCQRLGIKRMIGGDRVFHNDVTKVNQLEAVLSTMGKIVSQEFNVEFITPLKTVRNNREIWKALNAHGIGSVYDVSCIFDGQGAVSLQDQGSLDEDMATLVSQKIETEVIPALRNTLYELYGSVRYRGRTTKSRLAT